MVLSNTAILLGSAVLVLSAAVQFLVLSAAMAGVGAGNRELAVERGASVLCDAVTVLSDAALMLGNAV
jgi:hypothetical protein